MPPPAPANTFKYTIQGTFTGSYPAGNKAIGATCQMSKKVAGVWTAVPGTFVACGGRINPLGGIYVYVTPQIAIAKPPAGGDDYRFDVSWRFVPVVGLPGTFAVVNSAVTTVLP